MIQPKYIELRFLPRSYTNFGAYLAKANLEPNSYILEITELDTVFVLLLGDTVYDDYRVYSFEKNQLVYNLEYGPTRDYKLAFTKWLEFAATYSSV